MNILKKLDLYFTYRKIINSIREELWEKFNVRIDKAYRLYTVVNISEDVFGEAYSLNKRDVKILTESHIKEFIISLSGFLSSKGLTSEFIDFYQKIEEQDKNSHLIVLGFKVIRTDLFRERIIIAQWLVSIVAIISMITYFLIG